MTFVAGMGPRWGLFGVFAFVLMCATWFAPVIGDAGEDLYQLLQISRHATNRDIRKAFKKLAVQFHPDKNKDDNADEVFAKLARAYEVLKDPDARKRYDLFGDIDDKPKQNYPSYTYYQEQFGLYDEDPLIVTLTRADYELNILDNTQEWFVNFYSSRCHHCHTLTPIWRDLSTKLEGVVRIAAVNCEEDWALCHQLGIKSYPTLLYYKKDAQLYEGERYDGDRTIEALQSFVLERIPAEPTTITKQGWSDGGLSKKSWFLFLCFEWCPEPETRKKIAAIFEGLVSVGEIHDEAVLSNSDVLESKEKSRMLLWQVHDGDVEAVSIVGSDTIEIVENVLKHLPEARTLGEEDFYIAREELKIQKSKTPWLICFYIGAMTELTLQLQRLQIWLSNINIAKVDCARSAKLCTTLNVPRYPVWGVLKAGGAFELHHGRDLLPEIVAFARDGSKSTNLHALSPEEFYEYTKEGKTWFIDWFAPWCPPCKKLLPEIRKASQHFKEVRFGTIDCTLYKDLCTREGVRAYPTTRLYNGSHIYHFHGVPNEQGIIEFIENMINSDVICLDDSSFVRLVRKSEEDLWVVAYHAPWCGPCQKLMPHLHGLANQVSHLPNVKIAEVDCAAYADLCSAQGVRSYPTIRLYPLGSKGLNTVAMYNGFHETSSLKRWVLNFLPLVIKSLTPEKFSREVLTHRSNYVPWLIDFYAPWCEHCTIFEPEFITVAQKLEGKVQSGKLDCEAHRWFCQEQQVRSYPTVMLYVGPSRYREVSTQSAGKIVEEVEGLLRENYAHDEL